jgi:CheY-like chemotaxis protein
MRVLIVDDDASTGALLAAVVHRAGWEPTVCDDGAKCIDALLTSRFDVIVLDLLLPHVDGFSVIQFLGEKLPAMVRRVIVVSAASRTHMSRLDPGEVWRILTKPFDVTALQSIIWECGVFARLSEAGQPDDALLNDYLALSAASEGARAAIFARIDPDTELKYWRSVNYSEEYLARWFPIELRLHLPLCTAAVSGEPQLLHSIDLASRRYPALRPVWSAHGTGALAAIPIRSEGRVIGVAGWAYDRPQTFDSEQSRHLLDTAERIAPLALIASS